MVASISQGYIDNRFERINNYDVPASRMQIIEPRTIPTTPEDLPYYQPHGLNVAILFADMRGFTKRTETDSSARMTVRVISLFITEVVACLRHYKGFIAGFGGDQVMAIFEGEDKAKSGEVATRAAIGVHTIIKGIINPHLKSFQQDPIHAGIGIDYGRVLVTRAGIRGNEGQNTLIWVSKFTNYASKFQAAAEEGETVVSERVWKQLPEWMREWDNWSSGTVADQSARWIKTKWEIG